MYKIITAYLNHIKTFPKKIIGFILKLRSFEFITVNIPHTKLAEMLLAVAP